MKISTSNVVKSFCAIFLLGILAVSCRKDPIFFIISTETPPIPPRIPGAPTNMVKFDRKNPYDSSAPDIHLFFVASGRLHWYGSSNLAFESPGWDRNYGIPQPGGTVISLAVTQDHLYALSLNSNNSLRATLQRTGHGPNDGWETMINISDYSLIQSIYSTYSEGDTDPGQLFAGARRDSKTRETYAILRLDGSTLTTFIPNTEMLSGAAYRNGHYYVCTRGDGIFKINAGDFSSVRLRNIRSVGIKVPIDPSDESSALEDKSRIQEMNSRIFFMGMIKLKNPAGSIIAIEREDGYLYEILTNNDVTDMFPDPEDAPATLNLPDNAFSQIFYSYGGARTGGYAMGGLTLWESDAGWKLLVASRQGTLYSTSYNNGYREFLLKPDGSFNKTGTPPFMITADENQYTTSLGKHPINHLFQTPADVDPGRIFFASTQTGGLWSYRHRSKGGDQWNAED